MCEKKKQKILELSMKTMTTTERKWSERGERGNARQNDSLVGVARMKNDQIATTPKSEKNEKAKEAKRRIRN